MYNSLLNNFTRKSILKFSILAFMFVSIGCQSMKVESTMDEFIEITSTMYGSAVNTFVEEFCCVKSFPEDIEKMSLNTRLTTGGFKYAPYRFLSQNQGLDVKAIKLKSIKQINSTRLEATFGTGTHDLVGPMQLENDKWLFCVGPVKVYQLIDGKRKPVDTKLYTHEEDYEFRTYK